MSSAGLTGVPVASIRSRLAASVVSFLLGFAVANIGVIVVPRPDSWLWLAVAIVLMLTGVVGVLFADTRRGLSVWAVLGIELFAVFTLLPLLWVFTTATGEDRQTLWPDEVSWSAFGEVWDAGSIRSSMVTTLLVAGLATVVAIVLAVPAAFALVHRRVAGRRWWYLAFVAALVLPTFVLAAPAVAQLLAFGVADSRLAMVVPTLALALPIAVWLMVRVFRRVPWSLYDSVRADGGSWLQRMRHFTLPHVTLDIALVTVLVFFWTAGDFALGAGLAPTDAQRPLPATLLALDPEQSRLAAAVGLWWILPLVLIVAVFSRRLVSLVGRS